MKAKKKAKKTAIYLRVSTLDQEKGLQSQQIALKEYCLNHNLSNRRWYRDRLSGADTKRPAFMRLQKDVFNGKVDTIVVWALDRITRKSIQEGLTILKGWFEKDIRVISVREQFDFKGAMGELFAGFCFAIARMNREILRENTKRGLRAAKAKGKKLGKRPKLFTKDILPLLEKGLTIQAIADKFNKTKPAIYGCLKRENVDIHELRRKLDVA